MSDKTVRIPARLWPSLEELGREHLRSPSEMCRYLIERGIIARQIKRVLTAIITKNPGAVVSGGRGHNETPPVATDGWNSRYPKNGTHKWIMQSTHQRQPDQPTTIWIFRDSSIAIRRPSNNSPRRSPRRSEQKQPRNLPGAPQEILARHYSGRSGVCSAARHSARETDRTRE